VNAAKEFGQLPSVVARDMAEDPGGLTVACMPLLSYARCKSEWDAYKGDADKMEHWKGTDTLMAVEDNVFKGRKERLDHRSHSEPVEGCRYCKKKGADRG
jgi:hypothetical protein